ncbi:MFS transporter [Paludibacterium yongneupense]|uniref:MFS transporter n=1 Tax=Paludibacterium yongneupense TaxID=400061 RepID=UPI0004241EC1|nr:MFS transporter [Paludibacterium yongneupense]
MTTLSNTVADDQGGLSSSLIMLLAGGAGLAVASLYYAQPMLGILAHDFHATPSAIGLVPTLTQLGYAAGILLLAPLGDRYDRRSIIVGKALALAFALALAALAPGLGVLCIASVAIGLAATLAQDLVPAAAALAPEARRGKTVGTVMTGLLTGILLSRVISGTLAQSFGWRITFVAAAASIAVLALLLARRLPRFAATTSLSYTALLGSLLTLWRRYPALRRAAWAQGLLSAAFSAFWSTLAVMLQHAPYHLGAAAAGAFGLAGAAGALAAPLAGHVADRRGSEGVVRAGAALVLVSFLAMAFGPHGLWLIAAATVLFDLGIQASLIAHQSQIYGLEPAARSRLNAVLVGAMFVGMAAGAAIGSQVLDHGGWSALCLSAALAALAALGVRLWPGKN